MAKKAPPKPPRRTPQADDKPPPTPKARGGIAAGADPLARALAATVRAAHGVDQASTLDMSEEIGAPRGYVGTRNIALDRALGSKIPLGRITEISGWPGAGKSTCLDQILAQCQADGGIAVLADTERTRNRAYMEQLGVKPESMVWIGGSTVETMFDEIETLARNASHLNTIAWYEALKRAKVAVPAPTLHTHEVYDTTKKRTPKTKPIATFKFARWGRAQAGALLAYQKANGLPESSVRDAASREALRPCVLYINDDDPAAGQLRKEALEAWEAGDPHPAVQPADRPIIIGWDSVAGTATEAEMAGDARSQHVATAAKVIRRNLRRLVQLIDDEAIGFILVNQRYERIQTGGQPMRGPKSETYGGGGIKYHTTIRIEVDRVAQIWMSATSKQNGEAPIGQVVKIKIPKNKVNDPHHVEEYGLIYGRGADNAYAIYADLAKRGVIKVAGGWSKFTDPTIMGPDANFRGWQGLANLMAEDAVLWARLRAIYMEGR